jgi:3-hydroxyacyl-CoA dehydrogenase
MNRGQVLAQAHARCLELAAGYRAPEPVLLPLAGPSGSLALRDHIDGEVAAGRKSAASASVEHVLADVLTGGPDADPVAGLEESAVYALERDAMLALTRSPVARARIEHMLRTGKPLNS